jgi:putative acetyltransferase
VTATDRSMENVLIRGEDQDDIPAIRKIVEEAFLQPAEARLVDRLRADGEAVISGIAIDDGQVVGHIMFSRMDAPFRALGLAPVAVTPSLQRNGIGGELIRWGLAQAKAEAWQGVFVLGDPKFYGRFGFSVALASGFESSFAGEHFMALALNGALPVTSGKVEYAAAFKMLDKPSAVDVVKKRGSVMGSLHKDLNQIPIETRGFVHQEHKADVKKSR